MSIFINAKTEAHINVDFMLLPVTGKRLQNTHRLSCLQTSTLFLTQSLKIIIDYIYILTQYKIVSIKIVF